MVFIMYYVLRVYDLYYQLIILELIFILYKRHLVGLSQRQKL